jgi:hypothetical protein
MLATRWTIICLLVFCLLGSVKAQELRPAKAAAPFVTATSSGLQVRFVSLGEVRQIRIEVLDVFGQRVFDSSFNSGNLFDWQLQDQQGQRLQDGSYLFIVTVRDLSEKVSQKFGTVRLQQQHVLLEQTAGKNLPDALVQALELSRLSEVQSPVDRVGVEVPSDNNSVNDTSGMKPQSSNSVNTTPTPMGQDGIFAPTSTGTGTTGRITKWLDGPTGLLGDSGISEVNGDIGIGTSSPGQKLEVAGGAIQVTSAYNNPNVRAVDGTIITKLQSQSVGATQGVLGTESPNDLAIVTGNVTRLQIQNSTGNVGIGVASPSAKLEVVGNLKLAGVGNGIMFPDGSVMSTASPGGGSPSGTSVVTAINDQATAGTINDNRLSGNIARLNGANAFFGATVFNLGLSANNATISNVGNPTAVGDAANKGYVDSNFLKLLPGAPQVSVGDANGTAPMVSLRGGSTCCSGPGGFTPADFKIFQNGSFVATGNLGIGVSPLEGKGYRTSWYTYKGAFRSGYADNEWDDANTGFFSWAGGSNSTASGLYSLSFGDTNFARSTSSIAFGSGNEVKGAAGFSAGAGNRVCDTYGVAFGNKAQSGGPLINGKCDPDSFNIRGLAAVAIGYNVTADQDHTTAMGKFASNNGFSGTFVWSDGSATASADTFRNMANNEFAARATGGFRFRTNLTGTTGCNLPAGSGVFNCTSSRYTKENFLTVSGEDVLSRVRKIPVNTWNYISESKQVRHMGPFAEDFYSAFGLGTDNKSIGVQDIAGVQFAAVKALELRTAELKEKVAEVDQLRAQLNQLEQRLAELEKRGSTQR